MICRLSIWLMWGVWLSLGLWCSSSAYSDPPPSVMEARKTLSPKQLSSIGPWGDHSQSQSAKPLFGFLLPWVWETESPLVLLSDCLIYPLPGLQVLLPEHLRERFVAAALSYITCSSEGELVCRENDCWCKCGPTFPECNCPDADIQAMEDSLLQIQDSWATHNRQFEESGKLRIFPHWRVEDVRG